MAQFKGTNILILNNRGSALVVGMISALSVGVAAAVIMQQSQITEKQTWMPRIKSSMVQVESSLRTALFNGELVRCESGARTISSTSCHLVINSAKLKSIESSEKGMRLTASIDQASRKLVAQVSYEGDGRVNLAPLNVEIGVPEGAENSYVYCPESQPLFVGIGANGQAVCESLPSQCPPGSYAVEMDPMRLTADQAASAIRCVPLPAVTQCPPDQYMVRIAWSGKGELQTQCAPRKNPFLVASVGVDPTAYTYMDVPPGSRNPYPDPTPLPTPIPDPTPPPDAGCPGMFLVYLQEFTDGGGFDAKHTLILMTKTKYQSLPCSANYWGGTCPWPKKWDDHWRGQNRMHNNKSWFVTTDASLGLAPLSSQVNGTLHGLPHENYTVNNVYICKYGGGGGGGGSDPGPPIQIQ